jgi:HEAT repeat protein
LVRLLERKPDAAPATAAVQKVRDAVIAALGKTQPVKTAQAYMAALGRIADEPSIGALIGALNDAKRDIAGRAAAAEALGQAAAAQRRAGQTAALKDKVRGALEPFLTSEADIRIRIACAISLCRMGDRKGVSFLLDQLTALDREAAARAEQLAAGTQAEGGPSGPPPYGGSAPAGSPAGDPQAVTELRIRAQEALTAAGDFVVEPLLKALNDPASGDTTLWAAAKTLGELRVAAARARLAQLLTAPAPAGKLAPCNEDPAPVFNVKTESGQVQVSTTRAELLSHALGGPDAPAPAASKYVRIAAAEALGRIGGRQAEEALGEALTLHVAVRDRMGAYLEKRGYVALIPKKAADEQQRIKLRDLLADLATRIFRDQEQVLFYISKAQGGRAGE